MQMQAGQGAVQPHDTMHRRLPRIMNHDAPEHVEIKRDMSLLYAQPIVLTQIRPLW